jgi:hypothetical protein
VSLCREARPITVCTYSYGSFPIVVINLLYLVNEGHEIYFLSTVFYIT